MARKKEHIQITRTPTADDLRPAPQQQEDFRRLREWEKESAANGDFVVGVPANEQKGRRFKLTKAQQAYFERVERWEKAPKPTLPFTD